MIKHTINGIIAGVSIIVTGICTTLSYSGEIEDKKCIACHDFKGINTPSYHPDTESIEENVCVQINTILKNITKGYFLAAHHADNDMSCSDCHGDDILEIGMEVDNEACFSCHESYESLAEKTKNIIVVEQNPHKSHLGEMDCTLCHHGHSRSRSYCLQCHSNFNMPIPGN